MGDAVTACAAGSRIGPVRIGVIGAGAMGAAHVETLARWVPGAQVVSVYDLDVGRAKSVAESVGAEVASSAEALIGDPAVQAVVVAAPDPLHEELALACLAAGKPTLLEKPLATSVEGSRRVVGAEVAVGRRLLQLGFMRRFDSAYLDLRAAVLGGAVGEPRAVHCVHRNAEAHPAATSEGVLVNSAIHEFDCVPWLVDDRAQAVTVFAPKVPAGALHDVQVAVLEMAGGVVVTVEVSVNARYGYDIHTEVVGTVGTVALTPPYGLSLRRDGLEGRQVGTDFVARFADAYRVELAAWVDGVRTGSLPAPSAWDGHLANLTAFAAVESLHSGARVAVPQESRPALYA
jgi:myo-inositol 2-dehydrogenase/D-chiro-inositol 1-dehydrogenase